MLTRSLWERASPRSRRHGGWHLLRRCSRARPLPQGHQLCQKNGACHRWHAPVFIQL